MNSDLLFCIALFILITWVFIIDWKLGKLQNHTNDHCVKLDLLLLDYFMRTKKKRKGTHKVDVYKVNKNDIEEIMKGKSSE